MSTASVQWTCSACKVELEHKQSQHNACHAPTRWHCQLSTASGLYNNYKRHAASCVHCSPDRLRQIVRTERADKENRLSHTAETESSQFAVTPQPREAVDSRLTCVFCLSVSHRCAHQRSYKSRGRHGRQTKSCYASTQACRWPKLNWCMSRARDGCSHLQHSSVIATSTHLRSPHTTYSS